MRGLCVIPGQRNSARLESFPWPGDDEGTVLIAAKAIGLCGTDSEIIAAAYGTAPPGEQRLILGHEALGQVLESPAGSGFDAGDWVVPMVRHPDPLPCPNCAIGEWDMCRNGGYTEHGIEGLHGFATEQYRLRPDRLVKVNGLAELGVLLEPTSVVAKAWEHIERIGNRALWKPTRVLVTGAGPVGLLAALLGRQRGLEVHLFDRVTEGSKPELAKALGVTYHSDRLEDAGGEVDIVLECTGAPSVIHAAIAMARRDGIVCLLGVSWGGQQIPVDVGTINRRLVLENRVIFGSVNANRRHYELAAAALARSSRDWLSGVVTRREPLERWAAALEHRPGDVKAVITLS